jgi:hypothetical protein
MKVRRLESDTRLRFFLANNPMGEFIKILSDECKRIEKKKSYGKQVSTERR